MNGKDLFVEKCHAARATCSHRAGTQGQQGPDLDAGVRPGREDGLGEDTVEGVVLRPDRQRPREPA